MRRAFLFIGAISTVACSSVRDGDGLTARDSAGVRIVESAAPAWSGDAWRLGDPARELDAPAAQATAGALLGDGRIALRAGPGTIRFYGGDGSPGSTVGGEDGPFASILSIERTRGDSLIVYDYGTHRLVVVGAGGDIGQSTDVPVLGRGRPPHRPHRLPDGTIVGAATRGSEPLATFQPEALLRDSIIVYRHWPGTGRTDTLAALAHAEVFVRVEGSTRGSVPYPYGRTSVLGVSRGRIVVGSGDAPELRVLDHEGRLTEIYRWSAEPEPVTDADLTAYVEAARTALAASPEDLRERTIARILAAPRPAQKAPFGQLRVDDEGNLWLGEAVPLGAEPARWTVLSADGRWLGTVETPDTRLLHIATDHVLVRTRTGTGAQVVRVLPVIRP